MSLEFEKLSPKAIVDELDKHIIGQDKAKRAVAIALRNRYRRKQLPKALQEDIIPKNIIMIGATGVGKTEIARRLTKLCGAPFIKVEATKFTEVGYVGRDVESMVRDLMTNALALVKAEMAAAVAAEAERRTYDRLLALLVAHYQADVAEDADEENPEELPAVQVARDLIETHLREGLMDDIKIEIPGASPSSSMPGMEVFPMGMSISSSDMNASMDHITSQLSSMFGNRKKRLVTVARAFELFLQEEKERLIDNDNAVELARERVETMGVIFIDEIDKIAGKGGGSGPDISREGVQRDILPIVEGSLVSTKHGSIDTSHILFIAAGAFSVAKPSDLIPELQGRFPIKVELEPMTAAIFQQILTQPQNSLIAQYQAMLGTEQVGLHFTDDGIAKLATVAAEQNATRQNIGARRLHSVLEQVLEEVSFNAPDYAGQTLTVNAEYVTTQCAKEVLDEEKLERYIL